MKLKNPYIIFEWPAPNYVDPVTRGPVLYIVNGLFFFTASVFVVTRLCTRIFVRKWFGLDDALIFIAWICGGGDMATIFWGYSHYSWDRHLWDGRLEYLVPGAKAAFAAKMFWATSSSCVRLSLLVLYYRLLNHLDMRKYRWAIHCNLFLVLAILATYYGIIIFACFPVDQYFAWPPVGTCINEGYADTIASAFNTLSEALIAALPIPMIMRLGMLTTERLSVIFMLCLGFLVSIIGTVRCYFVWKTFETDDLTWHLGPHWIVSEVEITVAMICACLPALRPVFTRMMRGESLITKVLRRGPSSWMERKSNVGMTTSTSTNNRSFVGYDPYCRTIDVEGIGLDGLGYTVTISAGVPGTPISPKKNRLLKVLQPEEYERKVDLESQSVFGRMKRAFWPSETPERRPADWQTTEMIEGQKGIEVVTNKTIEVVEESREARPAPAPALIMPSRSASRTGIRRQASSKEDDPQSFFNDAETEESPS